MNTATLYRITDDGHKRVMTYPDHDGQGSGREVLISTMMGEQTGYWFVENDGIHTDTWDAWAGQWLEGDYSGLSPSAITDMIVAPD